MSFLTGFGVSSLMYYGLSVAFPPPGCFRRFEEIDLSEGELLGGGGDVRAGLGQAAEANGRRAAGDGLALRRGLLYVFSSRSGVVF